MKKLIVAEKPSVARDIARVLGVGERGEGYLYGGDYVVTWALGHLVSLCEPGEVDARWQKWRMSDLPMLPAEIPLKALPGSKKQYEVVRRLLNSSKIDSVICATDSAREGELIFRYIYQLSGCKKRVERLWISSMTDAAIRAGFASLRPDSDYDALYESARCRSVADWLVGMNASRAYSLRYNAHLSIGRVQTPTLNLIVKRDLEIENFVPQNYWEIRANFGDYEGLWVNPNTKETRAETKELAERIKSEVARREGEVTESEAERKRVPPPQLFDLTSLQREANQKFGFSADRTLQLAQALYERHKLLTYPRTDSRYLSDDMPPKIRATLKMLPEPYASLVSAPEMNPDMRDKRFYDNGKISDHHAIVPTEKRPNLATLAEDERKLYDLVARRLIAAHYPAYEYEAAKLVTRVNGHDFKSNGSTPLIPGWRAVLGNDEQKKGEVTLPKLSVGEKRAVQKVSVKANKTKPPQRHTDASILKMMENAGRDIEDEALREQMKDSGLGTPATRAATIERLIQMGYARRSGKALTSTEKGRKLISIVPEQIASAATTGKWEKALSAMASFRDPAQRDAKSARFLEGINRFSTFLVDAARAASPEVRFEDEFPAKPKRDASGGTSKPPRTKAAPTNDASGGASKAPRTKSSPASDASGGTSKPPRTKASPASDASGGTSKPTRTKASPASDASGGASKAPRTKASPPSDASSGASKPTRTKASAADGAPAMPPLEDVAKSASSTRSTRCATTTAKSTREKKKFPTNAGKD